MEKADYVKSYRDKELRQYVLAYLLACIASLGVNTQVSGGKVESFSSITELVSASVFVGAICILSMIFNELWTEGAKTKLTYGQLASDTVFSDIANGKYRGQGFDCDEADEVYIHLIGVSEDKQTAEWNKMLRNCKDAERGNVFDSQRSQLMTRDIFLSTVSLLIMTIAVILALSVSYQDFFIVWKNFWIPFAYLITMLIVTRIAAKNRAKRLVALVIKNDVQDRQSRTKK